MLDQLAPVSLDTAYPPPPGSATATAAAIAYPPPPAVAAAAAATPPQSPQAQPESPQAPALRTPQKTPEASAVRSPKTEPLKTPQAAPGLATAVDLEAKTLAANWSRANVLGSGPLLFLVLAVFLYAAVAYLSAEPPAPGLASCTWRWDAFRCSTGCKPRVHLPLLQDVCTPM